MGGSNNLAKSSSSESHRLDCTTVNSPFIEEDIVRQLHRMSVDISAPSTSASSQDSGSNSYMNTSSQSELSANHHVNSNVQIPNPTSISKNTFNNEGAYIVRGFDVNCASTYVRSSTDANPSDSESEATGRRDDIDKGATVEKDSDGNNCQDDDNEESAIVEDSDSDDWEDDDNEENGPPSVADRPLFQRVDSKPNLISRRSLLTSALRRDDRGLALQNTASRSSPAIDRPRTRTLNGPSTGNSPQKDRGLMMMRSQASRYKPIIINMTTSNVQPPAMSPKTTRRNMLTSELTGSLRQNLLWERQQKNATTNAVAKRQQSAVNLPALRRAMTTGDVKGLNNNEQPQQQQAKTAAFKDDSKLSSTYNQFFDSGPGDYHKSGW